MMESDARRWAAILTDTYGLDLMAAPGRNDKGEYADFGPRDLHTNESFSVRVFLGWRSITAEFRPGAFSADLIHEMGSATADSRAAFRSIAQSVSRDGAQLKMRVNDVPVSPENPETWPAPWERLELSLLRSPLDLEPKDTTLVQEHVLTWGGRLLGMVIALLPVEEAGIQQEGETQGLPEGAKVRIEINRYERNRLNRAACIAVHGFACKACGIDLGTMYGLIGERYIHVHHIIPVSQLGEGYVINPAEDLVPVCPNCHAMLHRQDPPLTPAQLKEIIVRHGTNRVQ